MDRNILLLNSIIQLSLFLIHYNMLLGCKQDVYRTCLIFNRAEHNYLGVCDILMRKERKDAYFYLKNGCHVRKIGMVLKNQS